MFILRVINELGGLEAQRTKYRASEMTDKFEEVFNHYKVRGIRVTIKMLNDKEQLIFELKTYNDEGC